MKYHFTFYTFNFIKRIKDLIPNFEEAVKVVNPKLYRCKRSSGKMLMKEDLENMLEFHKNKVKELEGLIGKMEKL